MDELADQQVTPRCPRCGSVALFVRKQMYAGEVVPVTCGAMNGPCDWTGASPVQVPIIQHRPQRIVQ